MPGFNKTSVLLFCLVALVLSDKEQGERRLSAVSGDGDRLLDRRYAESTIASDMSKIMDSMVQKKFVNFLLTHREKKSEHSAAPEGTESQDLLNGLVKQEIVEWILSKASKERTQ
ncbi:gastric inhibitory polypeptide-like [Acipenser ruthenus]|uniref:gastric inhibitory polypeptide-like n=1 Tax=Acipenser ruthenus TaxID=7906 RepID=UPI0027419C91|nr:gastric inhibitory polypeptide-like [Acipenser ruthenus]